MGMERKTGTTTDQSPQPQLANLKLFFKCLTTAKSSRASRLSVVHHKCLTINASRARSCRVAGVGNGTTHAPESVDARLAEASAKADPAGIGWNGCC